VEVGQSVVVGIPEDNLATSVCLGLYLIPLLGLIGVAVLPFGPGVANQALPVYFSIIGFAGGFITSKKISQ